MTSDDQGDGVVAFRLSVLEQSLKEFRAEVHSQLADVRRDVQSAAFVPMNLYTSERETMRESIRALGERVDNQRTLTMWAVGLVVTAVGVVFAVVRAFG